jgi:hypothetical protein
LEDEMDEVEVPFELQPLYSDDLEVDPAIMFFVLLFQEWINEQYLD